MQQITKGRTSLFIAHRLSTILDADEILVLKHGRIVDRGTHHSLLSKKDGYYAELWANQNRVTPPAPAEDEGDELWTHEEENSAQDEDMMDKEELTR